MDIKKLSRQLICLGLIIVLFASFMLSIYNIFTRRLISEFSDEFKAKSINISEYLPFSEQTKIVKISSEFKLSEDLPVFDGAAALYPIFSAFVYSIYPPQSVSYENGDFTEQSALKYTNTRGAYKAIVDKTADIVICVAPSDEQLAYAKQMGVELEFITIGYDAFVFLVNSENPVTDLSEEQIRDIYSGKIKNWKEVGGANKPISPLNRNPGSGSQSALLNFMQDTPIARDYDSFLGGAIGFSFRYYVEGITEMGKVKMIKVNGVYPSVENIKDGAYPIVSDIYAVIRKDDDKANTQKVLEWMLSEPAQRIIEETGYIGVK